MISFTHERERRDGESILVTFFWLNRLKQTLKLKVEIEGSNRLTHTFSGNFLFLESIFAKKQREVVNQRLDIKLSNISQRHIGISLCLGCHGEGGNRLMRTTSWFYKKNSVSSNLVSAWFSTLFASNVETCASIGEKGCFTLGVDHQITLNQVRCQASLGREWWRSSNLGRL